MTKRTAADVEAQARKFAVGTAYPKGARAMMREVLSLLDSARSSRDSARADAKRMRHVVTESATVLRIDFPHVWDVDGKPVGSSLA